MFRHILVLLALLDELVHQRMDILMPFILRICCLHSDVLQRREAQEGSNGIVDVLDAQIPWVKMRFRFHRANLSHDRTQLTPVHHRRRDTVPLS